VRDESMTMNMKPTVPFSARVELRDQAFIDVLCELYGYDCGRCRLLRCRHHLRRRRSHEA